MGILEEIENASDAKISRKLRSTKSPPPKKPCTPQKTDSLPQKEDSSSSKGQSPSPNQVLLPPKEGLPKPDMTHGRPLPSPRSNIGFQEWKAPRRSNTKRNVRMYIPFN